MVFAASKSYLIGIETALSLCNNVKTSLSFVISLATAYVDAMLRMVRSACTRLGDNVSVNCKVFGIYKYLEFGLAIANSQMTSS